MARDRWLAQEAEDRIGSFSDLVDHMTYAIQALEELGCPSEYEVDILRDLLSKARDQVEVYEGILSEEASDDISYLNSEYLAGVL